MTAWRLPLPARIPQRLGAYPSYDSVDDVESRSWFMLPSGVRDGSKNQPKVVAIKSGNLVAEHNLRTAPYARRQPEQPLLST